MAMSLNMMELIRGIKTVIRILGLTFESLLVWLIILSTVDSVHTSIMTVEGIILLLYLIVVLD